MESHDGDTISLADWRHPRTLCGRNRLGENPAFLVILLSMYFVTGNVLTIMLNTLLGTIALSGDLLYKGTVASCFIMYTSSACFTNMFLPKALTHEKSGQTGWRHTHRAPKGKPPPKDGAEAPLLPDVLRDIPDETVKALVRCLVTTIFLGVTTSPVHEQVDAQQDALACRK